jgi:hypothetical protein
MDPVIDSLSHEARRDAAGLARRANHISKSPVLRTAGEEKIFFPQGSAQPFEKSGFGEENPRKSK